MVVARKFLSLTPVEQNTVLAAHDDGVFWRGDEMGFFMRVADEHLRMQDMGVEAYRAEAVANMRKLRPGESVSNAEAA